MGAESVRAESVRLELLVQGHVQGVGFRYWARDQALALGLTGTATNLADGRVKIVVEGDRTVCEQLLSQLRKAGEPPGRVDDVFSRWGDAVGESGFGVG